MIAGENWYLNAHDRLVKYEMRLGKWSWDQRFVGQRCHDIPGLVKGGIITIW